MIAVVVSRSHARFFDIRAQSAVELPCLISPATRGGKFHGSRGDSPGSGERHYHHRRAEELRRHYAAVAQRLTRLARERVPDDGIVVAGMGVGPNALRRALPPELEVLVVGTAPLNPRATTPDQVRRAAERAHTHAREREH